MNANVYAEKETGSTQLCNCLIMKWAQKGLFFEWSNTRIYADIASTLDFNQLYNP